MKCSYSPEVIHAMTLKEEKRMGSLGMNLVGDFFVIIIKTVGS